MDKVGRNYQKSEEYYFIAGGYKCGGQSDVEASKGLRTSNNTLTLSAPTMEKLQKIAEASVISTLSAVYLLQGKSESVDEVESLAKIAWRAR